jgi:hypothetical protein
VRAARRSRLVDPRAHGGAGSAREGHGPLFAALIFGVMPPTSSGANFDLEVQGLLGVSIPVSDHVNVTGALEVPYNFDIHRTVGLTPLVGIAIRL